MTITMFDSTDGVSVMPIDAKAYAGYVNGTWQTYKPLVKAFPKANVLSISVNSAGNADCLDIEKGDATIQDAAPWYRRQIGLGVKQPVIYTSVSNVQQLLTALSYNEILRNEIRIWTAHYGAGEHICGPLTCRQLSFNADGTQWSDHALNRNLDQSLLNDTFFNSQGSFGVVLNAPVIAIKRTLTGGGYWLLSSEGGVYAFGDAVYYGGMAGKPLNKPIVDMAVTKSGLGYWLVGQDGGVFGYGDAQFFGSIPGLTS